MSVNQRMSDAAENSTSQIKAKVFNVSQLIIDIIPEHEEKIHVPGDVQKICMQKGVG